MEETAEVASETSQQTSTKHLKKTSFERLKERYSNNGSLLDATKNAANRSKWFFGLFAGLIAIIGNSLFDNMPLTTKAIILLSLIGSAVNGIAMSNIEKIYFELNRQYPLQANGEPNKDIGTVLDEAKLKAFGKYVGVFSLAVIIGVIAGLTLVISMYWVQLKGLLCSPSCYQP